MDTPTLDNHQKGFTSDNIAGASPEIVHAMAAAALGQAPPYGADSWTASARARFAEVFEREVDVIPVSTGSAANALSLAAMTPPWGSVLCHPESHINNDECGAPEFSVDGLTYGVEGEGSQGELLDDAGPEEGLCRPGSRPLFSIRIDAAAFSPIVAGPDPFRRVDFWQDFCEGQCRIHHCVDRHEGCENCEPVRVEH